MAYFARIAGAKRVYAVEQDAVVELARAICNHNGFQDRVDFLNEWSDQVELPEQADVLITEAIGNVGFEEGILGWIIDAKNHLLRHRARWDWRVHHADMAGTRCAQSTLSGQFKHQPHQNDRKGKPIRSVKGEVDLYILRMMDGFATSEEITKRTMSNFPLQFSSFDEVLPRVQQVANYYGHSLDGQSTINSSLCEEMLWEPKTKVREV